MIHSIELSQKLEKGVFIKTSGWDYGFNSYVKNININNIDWSYSQMKIKYFYDDRLLKIFVLPEKLIFGNTNQQYCMEKNYAQLRNLLQEQISPINSYLNIEDFFISNLDIYYNDVTEENIRELIFSFYDNTPKKINGKRKQLSGLTFKLLKGDELFKAYELTKNTLRYEYELGKNALKSKFHKKLKFYELFEKSKRIERILEKEISGLFRAKDRFESIVRKQELEQFL